MVDRPYNAMAWEVPALLDGRRTMARRVIKPQPEMTDALASETQEDLEIQGRLFGSEGAWIVLPRPLRYAVGDRLWVREAWKAWSQYDDWPPARIPSCVDLQYPADEPLSPWVSRARPSIHMPRWASRLTLTVTEVRVERLQDMEGQHPSESDAIAEGVNAIHHGDGVYYYSAFRNESHPKNWCDPTDAFRELWNSLHGPDAWAANPWIVAVRFTVERRNIDDTPPA